MTFADLRDGDHIFLDANPLVYYFAPDPTLGPACTAVMERVQKQDLVAFTSTHVLSEIAHLLMTIEAATLFTWKSKVVKHLKGKPTAIQQLNAFRQAVEKIPAIGIRVLTIPSNMIATAAILSQQHGLLSNDALIVAVMQANNLTNLASNDADFDRVPGITRYVPG